MPRPTVLVMDREETRRRDLVHALAGHGYEVIAAATSKEGKRFANGLRPGVIVAEAALVDVVGPFGFWVRSSRQTEASPTVVLLSDAEIGADVPDGVRIIALAGLAADGLLRKVRTALISRESGLATDPRLESLVADLQELPFFDLLPLLQRAKVTGHVELAEGQLFLADGEVFAAQAGTQRGVKAFARLARTPGGSARFVLGSEPAEREIFKDLLSLMAIAMEDQHQYEEARTQLPDLSSRLTLTKGPIGGAMQLSPPQQSLLEVVRSSRTLWDVLDLVAAPDGEVLAGLVQLRALGILEFGERELGVRIVTDSTADLPPEFAKRHQIHIVPLSVTLGNEIYKDGVDLTPDAFYRLLQTRRGSQLRTNPPGRGEFLADYRMLVPRTDVVSVHLSEAVSQTVANARAAASEGNEEFRQLRGDGGPALEVVDSTLVSTGLALLVVLAARLAERRLTADEIRTRLEAIRSRVHLLFVADTVEYLAQGVRPGKARAWLASLLGVKPIIGMEGGEVVAVDQIRIGSAAHPRVIELLKQKVDVSRPVMVGVGHGAAPVLAVRLRNLLQDNFKVSEFIESEIGPGVGAFLGPGCVGVAVFQPTQEEEFLLAGARNAFQA
jgi:DegV family protein with EDD domain